MLAFGLLLLGVFSRLIVHLPNFTPVIALALFSGVYLKKKYAVYVPLVLMMFSDLFLGLHNVIFFTWGSVALIAGIGIWARKYKEEGLQSAKTIFGTSLFSAVLFFIITNFGAWLFMYPRTLEGFVTCYVAAIPFFRNTIFSTLLYSVVLFGLYEVIAWRVKSTRLARVLLSS